MSLTTQELRGDGLKSLARMSFSGADTKAWVYLPGLSPLLELNALQTVSVSIFREKVPVKALGSVNIRGVCRGPRTVAGSLIFTMLDDHPLSALFANYAYDFSYDSMYRNRPSGSSDFSTIYPDTIPPFNMLLTYQNELGARGIVAILGIDLSSDGTTTSIQDMVTENTYQYIARDVRIFRQKRTFDNPSWLIAGAPNADPNNDFITQMASVYQILNSPGSSAEKSLNIPTSLPGRDIRLGVFSPKGEQ